MTRTGLPSFSRSIAAAAFAGLLVRLALGFGYLANRATGGDEREYLSLARGLASGQGLTYTGGLLPDQTAAFSRAPGYPAFLAVIGAGRADPATTPASVLIAQSIVGALGVLVTALLARRLAGPRAGRAAAWTIALYPPLVWTASYTLSEGVFWPAGLAVTWLFDRAVQAAPADAARRAWLCGLAAGVCVLIRPGTLLFLLLAGLWLIGRRQPRLLLALACGAALCILPWTARNYAQHHRWILVAAEGGVTFWTGNHPAARGEGDIAANPVLNGELRRFRAAHPGLSEEALEPLFYRAAFQWIRGHPVAWLALEARKVFYTVVPIGPSYIHRSKPIYAVASVSSYLVLLPFAVAGLARLGPRRARLPGLWLLAGASLLQCLIFFPQERFRFSVIDPAMVICAASLAAPRGSQPDRRRHPAR